MIAVAHVYCQCGKQYKQKPHKVKGTESRDKTLGPLATTRQSTNAMLLAVSVIEAEVREHF